MRIWEYCPFSVSRYCRKIVSRLMAFTRDTSIPDNWMSAGIRSTPSGWCRIPSPGRSGSSIRIRPIASDSVKGSLSGWGLPRLIVRLPCGSPSISRTFFPACAKLIPRLAQVVVLPTPPFWLAMAMICVFIDFTSFLIVSVASGNRKSRHSKIKSEVTALSIAGIRVPEMKKAPSHFILSAVSNSYSIIQIRSNYVKLPQTKTREQRAEKRPQNTPKNRLSVNHFGHHLTLFLPSFWPVNHLRTTKNWVKTVLVFPNLVKLYQPV